MNTFKPDEDVILLDEVVITPSENSDPIGVNKADQINATIAIPWELVAGAGATEAVIAAPSTILLTAILVLVTPNSAGEGEREHLQRLHGEFKIESAMDQELPRTEDGVPIPDAEATGPHTQIGTRQGRKGPYRQAREFDENGNPVKDIDFTDHGRPKQHTNPHQHQWEPNKTGGTPRRGPAKPLN